MRFIAVIVVSALAIGYVSAKSQYRPVCRRDRDCRNKDCGQSGIKRDSNGCPLRNCPCNHAVSFTPPDLSCVCVRAPCPCPVSCPRLSCPVNCEKRNGWVKDRAGCNTCQCKPRACGPVCKIFCEHGNVVDKFGCPTCQCKPAPNKCSLTTRNSVCRFCPNGYLNDRHGCPTCNCKPGGPVCLPRLCAKQLNCPNGYDTDRNGCTTCTCKPRPCPLVRCSRPCPNGFKTDKNGCQTCECKCGPLCRRACPYGFEKDESGCPICQCKPRPCPQVRCSRPCPNGFKKDKNGCQTCECKCGPVCLIFCEFGNVEDEFGCPICQCKPAPATWNRWESWSSCSGRCGTSGTRRRTRTCSNPSGDGELCPGSDFQTQSCINRRCPRGKPGKCPALRLSSSSSACENDYDCSGIKKCCSVRPRVNVCINPIFRDDHSEGPSYY